MKGLLPLFLGIFGTFTFSWVGLTVIPNFQIGHLDPQIDEEGTDVYPAPKSGMAERGRRVYVANGCYYCHSQWLRADYAASDIDRKWGERRSAPRDYVFDRPVLLGKTRLGPDLSNVGKRAPVEEESPSPAASASPAGSPGAAPSAANSPPAASPAKGGASPAVAGSPAAAPAKSPAPPSPRAGAQAAPGTSSASPSPAASSKPGASPAPATPGAPAGPSVSASPSPAASPKSGASPAPAAPAAPTGPNAAAATPAASPPENPVGVEARAGEPAPYSAAWHHRHLYSPRSITLDSNMPAYRFLYEKRRVDGEPSFDALKLTGSDAPPAGWEIVPSYDATCLVAYLMSLNQSHPLKEVKAAPAASPAAAASPAPPAAPPPPAGSGSPPAASPPKGGQ
jgi:cbb3-type cytochrome oxidase cytochrome c subunit